MIGHCQKYNMLEEIEIFKAIKERDCKTEQV